MKDANNNENVEARRLGEGRCPRSNSCSGTTPPAPHQHTSRAHQSTQQHTTRARRTRAHQLGAVTLCRLSGRQRTPRRSLCTLRSHRAVHHGALCTPHCAPHDTKPHHRTLSKAHDVAHVLGLDWTRRHCTLHHVAC